MSVTLAEGASAYAFEDPRPGVLREVTVHTYRPATFKPPSPVVLVLHGVNRNGADYRNYWIAESERRGLLIVAPEFPVAQYAQPFEYNFAGMRLADGTSMPQTAWLYGVLDAVFRDACVRAGSTRERYFLFGHSAGAQVVHRLVTFGWSGLVERAVAANAGSYTLPFYGEEFPFGLVGAPLKLSEDDLRALFSRPLVVLLGDSDTDPASEHLPRDPGALRQGPHRFARGQHYFQVGRREAERLGVALAWRLVIAPGIGHSGEEMAHFAACELFDV